MPIEAAREHTAKLHWHSRAATHAADNARHRWPASSPNAAESCPVHGPLAPRPAPSGLFARIRQSVSGTPARSDAQCEPCRAAFEAECEAFAPLLREPEAYRPSVSLTRKQALWLGGLSLGSAAGMLAHDHWHRHSARYDNVSDGKLPEPLRATPLSTWRGPALTAAPHNGGMAAARRAAFERARSAPPQAQSHLLPEAATATTETPRPSDDVKAVKLDFSCVEARAHLSFADVLRQIGRTLQNPFSAMATETQVVYFYEVLGRCPTADEARRLSRIFGAVDAVVSAVIGLLPYSKAIVLSQAFLGPLLQAIADDLDGLAPDREQTAAAIENASFLARSMVAAAPRDRAGNVIGEALAPPAKTRFGPSGPHTQINGDSWRLSYRDGRFLASRDGRSAEVEYVNAEQGWRLRGGRADVPQTLRRPTPVLRFERNARIARRLSVVASSYQSLPHPAGAGLYQVALQGTQNNALCVRIEGHFVPVRVLRDGVSFEAYDRIKPGKAGYPLRTGNDGRWTFGEPERWLAKAGGEPTRPSPHLSTRLRSAIPRGWIIAVDETRMLPADSRGVVKADDGQHYLRVDDGVVPIERHRLFPQVHQIGPRRTDKLLCTYDREQRRFMLVPEERGFTPVADAQGEPAEHAQRGDSVDDLNELMLTQERIAKRFREQRQKATYREGFRTTLREEFALVVLADESIEASSEKIICYGLGDDELAVAGKYQGTARELKHAVVEAARRLQTLKSALRNPTHANRLLEHLFERIGGDPDADMQKSIRRHFRRRVDATAQLMSDHVADECRRIWLVKLADSGTYGLTLKTDPLKRIFINIKESGAYRSGRAGCALGCERPVNDDVATIIHEASHLGADTDDIFYMRTPTGSRPLADKIQRLSAGEWNRRETRQLLALARTNRRRGRLLAATDQAADIFNTRPDVRAKLLMRNADSFAQLVLELTDGQWARHARDTASSASIPPELLSAFVAQALWQHAAWERRLKEAGA